MHISEILRDQQPAISFEFFPPKTEVASQELFKTIQALVPLKPAYVSVTYGAGGSTRELTHGLVVKLQQETSLTIVSHLTCVGAFQDEIHRILEKYQESGIHNIMALRGDQPQSNLPPTSRKPGFEYAFELVAFIKKHFPHMGIGVAGFPEGHPDTPNRLQEMDYLKRKVDAGADYICTQLFFENRDFYDFRERCEIANIQVPIIAGIMPITTLKGMVRMSELALGARIPAPLLKSMFQTETHEQAERIGTNWATEQVQDLLDHHVQGVHLYTLNKSKASLRIHSALGVQSFDMLNQ